MMSFSLQFVLVLIGTFMIALVLTPLVRLFSFKIDAVDYPNARRINTKPMPSAGGLSIVIAFSIATLVFIPMLTSTTAPIKSYLSYTLPVVGAGWIIALTGLIDDVKELSAKKKTVIWIVAITNAVNLIDGLDGLVSGVSIISLVTMGIVSYFFLPVPNLFLTMTIFVLVASIAGFFPFNYHPAILYLGDTGALFIGFMISVLSLQGLKNSTAVAVVTPMIILGVPITDTFLAIIRRTLSGQKFYKPDRNHLHHRLLSLGLTHRGTVLVIYGISMIFSLISLLLNISSRIGGVLLVIGLLFGVELLAELIGILGPHHSPLLNVLRYIGNSSYREEVRQKRKEKTK